MKAYGWAALACYNLVVCAVYGLDKLRARRGWRRTPEATLLWLAALGGGVGAWLGMHLFHHKTQKPRFAWGVPLLAAAQAALLVWFLTAGRLFIKP